MTSKIITATLLLISIFIIEVSSLRRQSFMTNSDRFYSDVKPGSKDYASLLKETQRALNRNSKQGTSFRKIIKVVAVKRIEDVADAGFNRIRVITGHTNCTLGSMTPRMKCSLDHKRSTQDCRVSLQYNYFPHLNYNPRPKTSIQCQPNNNHY